MHETRPRICLPDLDALDANEPRTVALAGARAFEDALLELIGYGERLEVHVRNSEASQAINAADPYAAANEAESLALTTRAMGALGTAFNLMRRARERLEFE